MATEKLGGSAKFFASSKPYLAMISLQFGYAGMNIITKVSLNQGMSHYVLVVYRHAFATAVIAPFAFIFERLVIIKNAFCTNYYVILNHCVFIYNIPNYFLTLCKFLNTLVFLKFKYLFNDVNNNNNVDDSFNL